MLARRCNAGRPAVKTVSRSISNARICSRKLLTAFSWVFGCFCADCACLDVVIAVTPLLRNKPPPVGANRGVAERNRFALPDKGAGQPCGCLLRSTITNFRRTNAALIIFDGQ